jgi:sec-independent protein translocase protein TatB
MIPVAGIFAFHRVKAMFGPLGGPELVLIFIIALIVFGPRKLPEMGKSLGKMMAEFRRASNDLKRTIENEVEADQLRESVSLSDMDGEYGRDSAASAEADPPSAAREGTTEPAPDKKNSDSSLGSDD